MSSPSFQPVRHHALTDVGVKRTHNQDAFAAQPAPDAAHYVSHGHVFVVADGMGGHAVGEKASAKAVRDIPLTYIKHVEHEGPAAAIKRAFVEANKAIFQIGQNNPEFKGLGTTGTALFLRPDGAWVGHVGDSRAYRVRGGRVQQLTFDHSWVWEVARRQGVDPDELGDFKKNVIIRSLGPDAEVEVDVEGPHPVEPGDTFLLCSDGLCNLVPAEEIGAVLSTFPPDEAAKFLVELANVRGGPDNITVVIAQVPADDGGAAKKGGAGGLGKALAAWNKAVPWPLTAMGAGVLLAAVAVGLKVAGVGGFVVPFGLAAALIVAGLVGLVGLMKSGPQEPAAGPTGPELHLYRDYEFAITGTLLDRFAELEGNLKHVLQGKDLGVDWAAHARLAAEAAALDGKDPAGLFRARCLALQVLAIPFNKVRHKDESFRPNWLKSPESESGPAA